MIDRIDLVALKLDAYQVAPEIAQNRRIKIRGTGAIFMRKALLHRSFADKELVRSEAQFP